MLITKNVIKSKCVVVDRIVNERFFVRKEGKYFTVYEAKGKSLSVVLEISLKENNTITPEQLWGIIYKNIRNEKLYIERKELEKFKYESKEKFDEFLLKMEKEKEIQKEKQRQKAEENQSLQMLKTDDQKVIELEWVKRSAFQSQ